MLIGVNWCKIGKLLRSFEGGCDGEVKQLQCDRKQIFKCTCVMKDGEILLQDVHSESIMKTWHMVITSSVSLYVCVCLCVCGWVCVLGRRCVFVCQELCFGPVSFKCWKDFNI